VFAKPPPRTEGLRARRSYDPAMIRILGTQDPTASLQDNASYAWMIGVPFSECLKATCPPNLVEPRISIAATLSDLAFQPISREWVTDIDNCNIAMTEFVRLSTDAAASEHRLQRLEKREKC